MTQESLLLIVAALGWYNVGTIWAHELDIFRSWRLLTPDLFPVVQAAHWRKLPYWVLFPVALALAGSLFLVWYHPARAPQWALNVNALCQGASALLTGLFWARWQAALSRDRLGPRSPYLSRILKTHWIRTGLITLGGVLLMLAVKETLA